MLLFQYHNGFIIFFASSIFPSLINLRIHLEDLAFAQSRYDPFRLRIEHVNTSSMDEVHLRWLLLGIVRSQKSTYFTIFHDFLNEFQIEWQIFEKSNY